MKWLLGTWMLCAAASIGCAGRTVYVGEDSRVAHVRAGEPAPHDGWILTDAALIDLLECCETK